MKKIVILVLVALIFTNSLATINVLALEREENKIKIRVAMFPLATQSDRLIVSCLSYSWSGNGKCYEFDVRELSYEELEGEGEKPLNKQNYDVFIVGANYDSYLKEGSKSSFRDNVKKFLSDGGGYLGICAGAFLASQGYEKPDNLFEKKVNQGVLKIVNVYINDDFDGELQYLLKEGQWIYGDEGQVPIEVSVNSSSDIPIFHGCNRTIFNISYGGGAGLYLAKADDPKLGKIYPLLTYEEELMESKPIYFWKKALIGWVRDRKVETDIKGQYACVATTYDERGRIVLISSHAEIPVMVDGKIEEAFGKNTLNIPRVVYHYRGGERKNMSYNFWILRRIVAWLANVSSDDLPPFTESMLIIEKPASHLGNLLYFNNKIKTSLLARKLVEKIGKTVVIGNIDVEIYSENCEKVEFYIDGKLEYTDTEMPFEWRIDKKIFGEHKLVVKGYDAVGNIVWDSIDIFFLKMK